MLYVSWKIIIYPCSLVAHVSYHDNGETIIFQTADSGGKSVSENTYKIIVRFLITCVVFEIAVFFNIKIRRTRKEKILTFGFDMLRHVLAVVTNVLDRDIQVFERLSIDVDLLFS